MITVHHNSRHPTLVSRNSPDARSRGIIPHLQRHATNRNEPFALLCSKKHCSTSGNLAGLVFGGGVESPPAHSNCKYEVGMPSHANQGSDGTT